MESNARVPAQRREAGFTLVEALVAIVVLSFGLMAVTNLLLVAASSNTVANQGTAAVTAATRVMDRLKAAPFVDPGTPGVVGLDQLIGGGLPWDIEAGAPACDVAQLNQFHCSDAMAGVGGVHVHWWVTATDDPRLLHLRVRSEGTGALAQARSRAEFTNFQACTAASIANGGVCPNPN